MYAWIVDVGSWPPRVICIIEAKDRYLAEEKAEEFSEQQGIERPNYGDVIELHEHDLVDDVYKT